MRVVEVEIITGKGAGNVAFILCIKFISNNSGLPFTFARKQFPLRLAYAMTINKRTSKFYCQTLCMAGVALCAMLCTKKPSFEERMKLPLTPLGTDSGYGMGKK
jgi:hypothetical protein